MMRWTMCLILGLSIGISAYSQSAQIEGRVTDHEGMALDFANVQLLSGTDSSLVKLELSAKEGEFRFNKIPPAAYFIRISYIGLPLYESTLVELAEGEILQLPPIEMQAPSAELSTVVVKGQRPILEVSADKLIFNVQESITATGSDLLELLRKSPGVLVDQNNNVFLLGKSGVNIYLDNKQIPLQGEALSNYLASIQASEIEAIEILTNPSARYDAAGGAGVINVRMRKDKNLGANGNIDLGLTVLQTFRYKLAAGGNYRNKRWNIFGNYSYGDIDELRRKEFTRQQVGRSYDQMDGTDIFRYVHSSKVGVDFFPDSQHTLGLIVSGTFSDRENVSTGRTLLSDIGQTAIDSILRSSYTNTRNSESIRYNFNYQFTGNDKSRWNFDSDYGRFRYLSDDVQPNEYFDDREVQLLSVNNYEARRETAIDILTFKVDYERKLWGGKFEAGAKSAQVNTENDFKTYDVAAGGQRILDEQLSNDFTYDENVYAAYLNFSRKSDRWNFRAGLRAELTQSIGQIRVDAAPNITTTEMDTLNFFPSASVGYKVAKKHALQLSASQRLNRPRYGNLNPSFFRQDEFTFTRGNAQLTPEYVNLIELTHTYNSFLNTKLSYSHTRDAFTTLMDTFNVNSIFVTTYNVRDQYNYSLSVSGSYPLTDWWSTYTSLTAYHLRNEATFDDGRILSESVNNFTAYSQQTFKLPKSIAFEMTGFYSSPHIWGGTFRIDQRWRIDLGLQKKLWDGKGTLRVSATDIFKTMSWFGKNEFGALNMDLFHTWDSRLLRANFNLIFGNKKVKSRRRKVGLTEESRRT